MHLLPWYGSTGGVVPKDSHTTSDKKNINYKHTPTGKEEQSSMNHTSSLGAAAGTGGGLLVSSTYPPETLNGSDNQLEQEQQSKQQQDQERGPSSPSYQGGSGGNSNNDPLNDEDSLDDEEDDEFHAESNVGLTKLVLVAAATAATLGYDVGIMAAAIQPIEREMELTSFQKELAMGSLNFIAAVGALLGGRVANKKGRRPTVVLCCWIFIIGTLCMALAPTYFWLLLGRIITGVGVGVSFVVAPVYLSEVAPTHLRGQLNTVFDVAINGGILWGYIVGFVVQIMPLQSESLKWRIMLGMGLASPVLVFLNMASLPESPRWLVMANRSEQASQVLSQLGNSPRQVLRTVSSIEEEHSYAQNNPSSPNTAQESLLPWKWNWTRGMKLAVALGFWQQVTGTEAVLYYSADFLEHAGLESPTQRLLGNVFVGLCKLVPELIAMQTVDKIGRRPHILWSAVSLMTTTALLSSAFYLQWSPLSVVVLLCAVMASFSLGVGPFTFMVVAECLGLSERAWGVTVAAAINRMTSGTVALTAVSLYQALGSGGFFAVYAFIGLLSLPFYFNNVPETSGQSLEELAASIRDDAAVAQAAQQNQRPEQQMQHLITPSSPDQGALQDHNYRDLPEGREA